MCLSKRPSLNDADCSSPGMTRGVGGGGGKSFQSQEFESIVMISLFVFTCERTKLMEIYDKLNKNSQSPMAPFNLPPQS